jgi:hypothetical protein
MPPYLTMKVICKQQFHDTLTKRFYRVGDDVPWDKERAEQYPNLVTVTAPPKPKRTRRKSTKKVD